MDLTLFSKMVKELLSSSGRAVVEKFGVFSAEEVPAFFSDKGFTVNPPYRKVCFTLDRDIRDKALAVLYAQANDISVPQAERIVAKFGADLCEKVFASKSLTIPELGRLRTISHGEVFFIEDQELSVFPEFDCLGPISLKAMNTKSAPATQEPAPEPEITPAPESAPAPQQPALQQPDPAPSPQQPAPQQSEPAISFSNVDPGYEQASRGVHPVIMSLAIVMGIALIALAGLAVLGRTCPDLVDRYLFSETQIEIIKYIL